ncbi:hypothetical protein AcV5_005083 [Taiwanofungus camphoratus]|nr:hypothetical protein AcW2_000318 [Antrodia cinnamomea]KAI0937109.1 hypothetical protein AcV5_005083 [Antrodia cinnamomea]
MSRGPWCTAVPVFSQRLSQQDLTSPSATVCPTMDRRGRSRDVSPAAIARKANEQAVRARISVSVIAQSNLHVPKHQPPHDAAASLPYQPPPPRTRHSRNMSVATSKPPVASTSRLPSLTPSAPCPSPSTSSVDSVLPRTQSTRTIDSISPEPTPLGPLTPPEYTDMYCRTFPPITIPIDYYDRPPSPPRTLEDQMQVAYALDNMHLAKVLFLKLKGIDVTDDNDPRIAAVTDEDFSSSFVPPGGLTLEEADERRCREGERRERERRKRMEREERLRACERVWENSSRWLREENAKVARKKEEQARQKRRMEIEARERERERERVREARERDQEMLRHTRQLRYSGLSQRKLLCYDNLPIQRTPKPESPTRSADDDLFQNMMMAFSPRSSPSSSYSASPPTTPNKHTLSLPRAQHEFTTRHLRSISRTVLFSDVIASMHGPLFPDDTTRARSETKLRTPKQVELFESLFKVGVLEEGERLGKGKRREDLRPKRTSGQRREVSRACVACSLGSKSTAVSSTTSTITRSNSWFSFGSRNSRASVSTAVTTPSTSLSSCKSSSHPPSPLSTPPLIHAEPDSIHSCRHPLMPVSPSEHPLILPTSQLAQPQKRLPPSPHNRGRALARGCSSHRTPSGESQAEVDVGLVRRVGRSVSTLMDMAAQLQRAYMRATLSSIGGNSLSRSRSDSRESSGSRSPSRSRLRVAPSSSRPSAFGRSGKLRAEGYRACSSDVEIFLSAPADDTADIPQPTRTLIPLSVRLPASNTFSPQARVFALPAPPPRSPFRLMEMPPGYSRLARLRPVANPVLLRLQALQNVCAGRALVWEGRAREGRMCAGKEKMVGVAWEGIGRSTLGWEVHMVC